VLVGGSGDSELEAWERGDSPNQWGSIEAQWFWLRPELEAWDRGNSPTRWGAIEAQWLWLRPELEARDQGDSPSLTVVGHHYGPVILTSARIGSLGPGRFPYSVGNHWGPVILTSARIGSPGLRRFPYSVGHHWGPVIPTSIRIGSQNRGDLLLFFRMFPRESFRCMNHRQPTHTIWPLINQSSFTGEHVEIVDSNPGWPNVRTTRPWISTFEALTLYIIQVNTSTAGMELVCRGLSEMRKNFIMENGYGKPFVAIFNIDIYLFNKNICMQCLHFLRYLNFLCAIITFFYNKKK
jgi:hypothetical protein